MSDNKLIDKLDNDNIPVFNVSEITKEIKNLLENKYPYVKVKGEFSQITNWKGHIFTSLKEGEEVINAVIWKDKLVQLEIEPKEGEEVICSGRISTGKKSQHQLVIDKIAYEGEGQLLKKKEELKKKLEKEGLFDDKHKKKLPYIPNLIGVITSESGSVLHEMEKIINERFSANRTLYNVRVQGKVAIGEIISAIEYFNNTKIEGIKADVLIIARGGGSIEDLWCFNDEELCRAVFNSKIPIISAIGHEPDTNLIDYVADHRAATPSEAAVIVVPERKELILKLNKGFIQFNKSIKYFFKNKMQALSSIFNIIPKTNVTFSFKEESFKKIQKKFKNSDSKFFKILDDKLRNIISKFNIGSHINTLKRGYTFIRNIKNKSFITASRNIKSNQDISITFYDGTIKAITKEKKNN